MTIQENYKVKERAEAYVKKYGSIPKAIDFLKREHAGFQSIWGEYSSDCLGHGITCTRLMIEYLQEIQD